MQEKQVTIGATTYSCPLLFVMATENPIEQEGTYTLPEAQVDRLCSRMITYPERSDERRILDDWAKTEDLPTASQVVTAEQILTARKVVDSIYVDDKVKDTLWTSSAPRAIRANTRSPLKASSSWEPRPATIFLTLAAKSHAFVHGRGYVTPQDVKSIAMDVLRHRVHVSYEAEAEEKNSEQIVNYCSITCRALAYEFARTSGSGAAD